MDDDGGAGCRISLSYFQTICQCISQQRVTLPEYLFIFLFFFLWGGGCFTDYTPVLNSR